MQSTRRSSLPGNVDPPRVLIFYFIYVFVCVDRMSGILQLSKFSIPPSATATPRSTSPLAPQIVISQPGSEHDDDDDGTVGELGEAVGHLAISNHYDEYEEDDGDGDIVITDDESEQPSGSLLHTKTNSSEGGSSTILRTLELTAQTRIQRVRVKAKKKARVHFADLNLIQQLTCPSGTPVFSCKFSPDGAYLALGCGDGMIRVWAPLSELILQETGSTSELHELRTAAIFTEEPIQILAGHTAEVIDLSWSSVLRRHCLCICLHLPLEQLSAVRLDGWHRKALEPRPKRLPGGLPPLGHCHLRCLPPHG